MGSGVLRWASLAVLSPPSSWNSLPTSADEMPPLKAGLLDFFIYLCFPTTTGLSLLLLEDVFVVVVFFIREASSVPTEESRIPHRSARIEEAPWTRSETSSRRKKRSPVAV